MSGGAGKPPFGPLSPAISLQSLLAADEGLIIPSKG